MEPHERVDRRTPHIRGEERLALIENLALKGDTQAALADKYGRSHQAIKQFSARNSAEIAQRRQVLLGEVAGEASRMWVSDKKIRIAWRLKLIEDMDGYLADPELWRGRLRAGIALGDGLGRLGLDLLHG
jgi:hypothetical protein